MTWVMRGSGPQLKYVCVAAGSRNWGQDWGREEFLGNSKETYEAVN